jgi:uncharacterized membrane protein
VLSTEKSERAKEAPHCLSVSSHFLVRLSPEKLELGSKSLLHVHVRWGLSFAASLLKGKRRTHTHAPKYTALFFLSAVLMLAKGQPAVEKMRWRGRIFLPCSACRAVIVVGPRTQNLGPRAAVRLSFVLWRRTAAANGSSTARAARKL